MFQSIVKSLPVAVDAGFADHPLRKSRRVEGGLTFFSSSMAGDTVDIGRKHEAGRVRNPNPSASPIKISGSQVHFLAVAPVTIGWNVGKRGNLANFMPQGRVATGAFDLVVSDVLLMQEFRGKFRA